MEELRQKPLMANRGIAAVLGDACDLLTGNLKKISKHTWLCSLTFSAAVALFIVVYFNFDIMAADGSLSYGSLVATMATIPLLVLVEIMFYGRAAMQLNGQTFLWNSVRTLKLSVFYFAIGTALVLVTAEAMAAAFALFPETGQEDIPLSALAITGAAYLLMFIFMLLLLPYVYVTMKYYMEPETRLRKLAANGYKTGLRHWGFIFIAMLLTYIAVSFVSIIIFAPLFIIVLAVAYSTAGAANGDPTGMPAYFNFLLFAVTLLSYFVYTYVMLFNLYVAYYIYGTIETREKEKKEMTKTA